MTMSAARKFFGDRPFSFRNAPSLSGPGTPTVRMENGERGGKWKSLQSGEDDNTCKE